MQRWQQPDLQRLKPKSDELDMHVFASSNCLISLAGLGTNIFLENIRAENFIMVDIEIND